MKTLWVESSTDLAEVAEEVFRAVRGGEIVLVPTETQYGLCCDAENVESMVRLSRIKMRSMSMSSAVFVRDWSHASRLVANAPRGIDRFVSHFWPGPLTVVAESSRSDWPGIVSPDKTIGLRCSSHPLIMLLMSLSPPHLTATSANMHGESPSADPQALINWLSGNVELLIFDRGISERTPASTVIKIGPGNPKVLRVGGITEEAVMKALERETESG